MAASPDGSRLYAMLERPLFDAEIPRSPEGGSCASWNSTPRAPNGPAACCAIGWRKAATAIGDFNMIDDRRALVIERDNGEGDPGLACAQGTQSTAERPCIPLPARFKRVYVIDLGATDAEGFVRKHRPYRPDGDPRPRGRGAQRGDLPQGTARERFTFPFFTIEDVAMVDADHIIVGERQQPALLGRAPPDARGRQRVHPAARARTAAGALKAPPAPRLSARRGCFTLAAHGAGVDGMAEDEAGAFVPGTRVERAGATGGPLAGLSFAVKDLYDVAGSVTGYGNPDWARTHPPAAADAAVVSLLLDAGARLVGKTKTVELAYGLTGENVWHGTPVNPAAPDRFPGGSSCGSAAGVAAGLFDFAMGSDTGGSVRIPASYCGVFGIRPSWGAVSLVGACALGPTYDTAGWFAARASVLRRAGEVLLPPAQGGPLGPLLKVQEAWVNAEPLVAAALSNAMAAVESVMGPSLPVCLAPEGLDELYENFRCAQAAEAWATLGPWIEATDPEFGPGVKERFAAARAMDPAKAAAGRAFRRVVQARLWGLLGGGAVLVMPTSPAPAPLLSASMAEQNAVRERSMGVTAIAGLGGLAEVTLPAARVDDAPVGLSLVAAPGRDRALLALAERVAAAAGLAV